MKLNWAERLVVNNPARVAEQLLQIRWMKKVMPLEPGARILEIGCGRGAGAALILKEFEPAVLHAMDLDVLMLKQAVRYLKPAQRERINVYAADAVHLPYADGTMDAVFDFGALHHVPNWRRALSEISRVLKPGGTFFVEELYPSLYQNVITKHLLLHPTEDRFLSHDLREAFEVANLTLKDSLELKAVGILGVLTKTA
ncbi:MAG: class I SAM-dependent methyltransferase [Acidobacteriota bacterium]